MELAGGATAAAAEDAIRTHGSGQAPFGDDQNAAIVVAHIAIRPGVAQCRRHRLHQRLLIAALATLPDAHLLGQRQSLPEHVAGGGAQREQQNDAGDANGGARCGVC